MDMYPALTSLHARTGTHASNAPNQGSAEGPALYAHLPWRSVPAGRRQVSPDTPFNSPPQPHISTSPEHAHCCDAQDAMGRPFMDMTFDS